MASTKVTFVTGTAEVRRRDPNSPRVYTGGPQMEQPHLTTEPNTPSQVTYVDGKCTCCPYGYHIDLDFLNFCRDLESGSTLRNLKRIQRTKRKLRKSMELMLDEQDGIVPVPTSAPPDVVHSTEAGRLMHMVNYERSATHRILSHIDNSVGSTIANIDGRGDHRFASTSDSEDAYSPHSPHRRFMDESGNMAPSFSTSGRTDSMSSLSSVSTVSSDAAMMYQAQLYQQQQQQHYQHSLTQKTTTKVVENPVLEMGTAEMRHYSTSSSAQLMEVPLRTPPTPPPRASPDVNQMSLQSVREAMAVSLQRLRELEEQVKTIPILQVRISVLKEEKRLLNLQLKASKASSRSVAATRSIGVSEDRVDMLSPQHKTPPPTLPKPGRRKSVGVGEHSVIEPYNLQPDLPTGYTICENETHTEIYSSTKMVTTQIHPPSLSMSFMQNRSQESMRESRLSSSGSHETPHFTINQIKRNGPRPLTRTVGVGEGNVFDASGLHVHEKEFRTVLMSQGGVAKRNVGIECRVPTRDVGVLFKCDEEKPETRTVGVNVNYDTSSIVTSLDFRGETELRMALQGVLQRNVRSVGTNCNFRTQTMDSSTNTSSHSGVSVGTGDDQTMRIDVEIRPATIRKSVGATAKPDSVNKCVSTEKGWMLDASTNTYQADRMHRSVMTEKQRQSFAATNTESVLTRCSSNQTDMKMFIAMDQIKHSSSNTEKPIVYSVPVNTEPIKTYSIGVNTVEKVSDLFKPPPEQKTMVTTTESTTLFTQKKPLMVDRGVGDGVIQEDDQYMFSETTEVITIPKVMTAEEKILQRGASQASAFLTKSHEVSAVSDSTSTVSESHVDDGNNHYTSFERSRRSTAPSSHGQEAEETASTYKMVTDQASMPPQRNEDGSFQETIVEHYIITKDGKRLISEEKTTKSSAGNNHSFKRYSDDQGKEKVGSWKSGLSDAKGSFYSSRSSSDTDGFNGERAADGGNITSSTHYSNVGSSDVDGGRFTSSTFHSSTKLDNSKTISGQSSTDSSKMFSDPGTVGMPRMDKSSATIVTNPYRTVENLAAAMSVADSSDCVDASGSRTRQVSKTSSEGNLFKVQKKSSTSKKDPIKTMETIFDMRRTGSVEDFMPDNIRKYMSIDPSNSKDSGFGEDLLQRFSEESSKKTVEGMPYTVRVSKTVTTRRSTKSGDKVSVQETKTVEGEDGKVITTVTETDKDGNTVSRPGDASSALSSASRAFQSFGESDTKGLDSNLWSSAASGGMSYSESVITSVGQGDSSEDCVPEHSYGSLDRRTGKLKSILKHSKSEADQMNEKRGITFAETVKGGTGSSSEEAVNSSDSDDSTTSFEEGSYDSQQGQVIYRCKDDEAIAQGIPGAQMFDQNIRETYELTSEVRQACSVLANYLQDSTTTQTKELNASQAVVQQEWFQVSSLKLSSDHQVEDFLSSVNEISKRLLEYIVNMADANGNTAIHYCISHCNFHIASLLLDSEVCDIDRQNKAGYTPIMLAGLAEGHNSGQLEVVKRIFSLGDVNAKAVSDQQTALMLAASHGRVHTVRLLVEAGADLNAQDEDGSTALMCACEHGHLDIVNFLLAQPSIDASIVDNENSSALTVAMEAGHKDVGVVLYKHLNFSKHNSATASLKKRKSPSSPTPR
ncbi:KN motif and ankyrin repeat domain-containing protein 1 [Plakobranchus ocellatus]|uniref:KN motif and ankyrin repeat domain-containing protein 1 n=1 Tax=Plakobranchus ocellatus TaxID=259542 RepID=A0AAV3ZL61_9GAST|nr:KN motif and ankyrin repeat domain-containing protein 1 [Plakobranchus ocellatus]